VSTVADTFSPLAPFDVAGREADMRPAVPDLALCDTIFPNRFTEFWVKSLELGSMMDCEPPPFAAEVLEDTCC
jgi:hypothetical protein